MTRPAIWLIPRPSPVPAVLVVVVAASACRRVIATDTFSNRLEFVRKGTAHDLDDAIVKAAPAMFRDFDGRPVRRTDDGPAAAPLA